MNYYGNPNPNYPGGPSVPPPNNHLSYPNYSPGGYAPANPILGPPVQNIESSIVLDINFITSTKTLQSLVPPDKPIIRSKLEYDYNCFVKVEGPIAKSLFMIGFLLAKDAISHNQLTDWNSLQQQLRDNLTGPEIMSILNKSEHSKQFNFKLAITNLFSRAEAARPSIQLDDEATAVRFLVDQCKSNNEVTTALVHMARSALIDRIARNSMPTNMPKIMLKLRSPGWELEDMYVAEYSAAFCQLFQYKLCTFEVSEYNVIEKMLGHGKAEACMFESKYNRTPFHALLFRSTRPNDTDMQSGQILTRNKPNVQGINSSPMQQSTTASLNTSSSKEFDHCSLCGQEIMRKLIYTNPHCGHNYCLYCIQELSGTHSGLTYCYLKRCQNHLDQAEIRVFCSKCQENQSPVKGQAYGDFIPNQGMMQQSPNVSAPRNQMYNNSPQTMQNSMQFAPRRGDSCSMCNEEVNEANPIVYTNYPCGHTICKKWLSQKNPLFNGTCFGSKCPKSIDIIAYRQALKDAGISSFKAHCNDCLRSVDINRIFVNPGCKHRICVDCTEKLRTSRCPWPGCQQAIDEIKLLEFKEEFILSQDNQNLIKKAMACSACHSQIEISLQQGARLDYWKCPNCAKITCTQHSELMSQCLCLCPRCSGTLFEQASMRSCTRCAVSYCLRCKRESPFSQKCNCTESEPADMNIAQMMKPSANVNSIMKIVTQVKGYDNTCNECNDFRDTPNFFAFECGHRLCEYCILAKQGGYMPRPVMCLTCSK